MIKRPSWISKFLVSVLSIPKGCSPRRPWTKTRTSATTLGTGTRASNIQGGEDLEVLRSSDLAKFTHQYIELPNPYCQGSTRLYLVEYKIKLRKSLVESCLLNKTNLKSPLFTLLWTHVLQFIFIILNILQNDRS